MRKTITYKRLGLILRGFRIKDYAEHLSKRFNREHATKFSLTNGYPHYAVYKPKGVQQLGVIDNHNKIFTLRKTVLGSLEGNKSEKIGCEYSSIKQAATAFYLQTQKPKTEKRAGVKVDKTKNQ